MRIKAEILPIILSMIPSLIVLIVWLSLNTQLPSNDASNYLMTILDIKQSLNHHGFISGLFHSLGIRGWRPIAFPHLTIPILVFTDQLYYIYSIFSVAVLALSVIYIYLYFRLCLSVRRSLLATSIISLLPLLLAQVIMFYSESVLFFAILGVLYHIQKSDYLKIKSHSVLVGLFLSLALLVRPIEAISQLVLVFLYFIALGYVHKKFYLKQILLSLTIVALSSVVLLMAALIQKNGLSSTFSYIDLKNGDELTKLLRSALFGFLFALLFFSLIQRFLVHHPRPTNNYLTTVIGSVSLVFLLWYLPFSYQTFDWIYRTSLGDVAKGTGSLTGTDSPLSVINIYIHDESLLIVIMLLILALISIPCIKLFEKRMSYLKVPILFLLLTMPLILYGSLFTVQIVTRKLAFVFPALLMVFIILALQNGRFFRIRVMSLICTFILLFSMQIHAITSRSSEDDSSILIKLLGTFIPKPVSVYPNPHDIVLKMLKSQYDVNPFDSVGIELNPGTPDARHFTPSMPVDPFLLGVLIAKQGYGYYSNYMYIASFETADLQVINEKYDVIILSDVATRMKVSSESASTYFKMYSDEKSPSLKLLNLFLYHYASKSLDRLGYQVETCHEVLGADSKAYRICLLVRSKSFHKLKV